MSAVKVHYLSGDPLHLESCPTIGSLMAQVAMLHQRFAADIAVVCLETGKDLTKPHTEVPPPTVTVVLKQAVDRPTEDDLRLTLFLHAEREDTATCVRVLNMMRKHYPRVSIERILQIAMFTHGAKDQKKMLPTLIRAGINGAAALAESAYKGDKGAAARRLIAAGVCPNTQLHDGSTALIRAASFRRMHVVGVLLSRRADVNHPDRTGRTAVMVVCSGAGSRDSLFRRKSLKGLVELLLHHGADVNRSVTPGSTALIDATRAGHKDLVEILLTHAADVNHSQGNGQTALTLASSAGRGNLMGLLLAHGAQVDHVVGPNDETALMRVSRNGWTDRVEVLIAHGAQVNRSAKNGHTAFMHASRAGCKDVMEALIAHGAEVNLAAKNGNTALGLAAVHGQIDVVEILLKHGAQINGETLKKATKGGPTEMVRVLLTYGTFANCATTPGWMALIKAALQGRKDLVERLLARGVHVNKANSWGMTALMAASSGESEEMVAVLLSHGARVNDADEYGCTALIAASIGGHDRVVELLLSHGAEVNHEQKDGTTALEWARKRNRKAVAKKLLSHSKRGIASKKIKKNADNKANVSTSAKSNTSASKKVKKNTVKKANSSTLAHKKGETTAGTTGGTEACDGGNCSAKDNGKDAGRPRHLLGRKPRKTLRTRAATDNRSHGDTPSENKDAGLPGSSDDKKVKKIVQKKARWPS
eukprot:GEMP01008727.1.p1 GENE.GEMP01008727.1~~GEMP01008727.1.p1  ORF type:complete len:727 (+),score=157.26 GEMP01008727.1:69-2183(+)